MSPIAEASHAGGATPGRPRVLIVEDDAAIRRGLVDALRFAGYEPIEAVDAASGAAAATGRELDLVLLDLILPGGDGLDVLRQVRRLRPTLPVIILTARGEEDDRVSGLRAGADDYVLKPFSVKELLARVEAVLRRSAERASDLHELRIGASTVDFRRREVRRPDGARSELSERETELLHYLAGNAGRAISRDELLASVWRISPRGLATRTIDMHVARLREKLGDDAAQPAMIVTVRGKGYMLAGLQEERGEGR